LILDSAYESEWKFLEEFEDHFLSSLASLSNVFVIVSGRGRPYPWKTPEISKGVKSVLEPFSEEQIQEQLKRLGLEAVLSPAEIRLLGAGAPICTVALAQAKDQAEGLRLAANLLFLVVPSHERAKIRPYFEALCVLGGFREEEIPAMLSAYFDDASYEKLSSEEVRRIRDAMIETYLVHWDKGRYMINDPLRSVFCNYLFHVFPEIWQRLHCRAYRYYLAQKRKPELKRFETFLAQKAGYHESELVKTKFRVEKCPPWPKQETTP